MILAILIALVIFCFVVLPLGAGIAHLVRLNKVPLSDEAKAKLQTVASEREDKQKAYEKKVKYSILAACGVLMLAAIASAH